MIDAFKNISRTHYCGDLSKYNVGETVTICGWVQRQRDLGQLIFIDLRDRSGIVQLAFTDSTDREIFDKAFHARNEFVLAATGVVRERSSINVDIKTGEIEIEVTSLSVLGRSETPPFEIVPESETSESIRLKYRYLDLRRPDLQQNIMLRHKITKFTRDYFDDNGFVEIETPILIKSTPEGARDFLVPSRQHPGTFYALPQSPQLYKQLSMVAGFDRYMQIARCFRDEDLRADRQPEFTQVDVEMSFVTMEDVLAMLEGYVKYVFEKCKNIGVPHLENVVLPDKFPRMTYTEAMNKYGSDKPDIRFDMELCDITDIVKSCEFGVFADPANGGGSVRAIVAKNAVSKLSRKAIDKLTEFVRGIGAKGLAWARLTDDGTTSSYGKFLTDEENSRILSAVGAETGDVVLIVGDMSNSLVLSVLGSLRIEVANQTGIERTGFAPLWITEFPFFEKDDETGEYNAMHHPFTSPLEHCVQYLETAPDKVFAQAYDFVLNGVELSSGSIRITDPVLQNKMFKALGFSDEEAYEKFGFLLDAFKYGAPPHGGFGIGLDRFVMELLKTPSLRDVVAYPKVQNMSELMTNCPAVVDGAQLEELHIKLI